MAKDDPKSGTVGGTTGKGGAGTRPPRRPPPTIDLSARDVTPAPVSSQPVSDEPATTESFTTTRSTSDTEAVPAAASPAEVPVLDATPDAGSGGSPPDEPPAEPVKPAQAPESAPVPPAAAGRPARQLGLVGVLAVALLSGIIGGAVAFAVVGSLYGAEENAEAITDLEARALDLRQRLETLEASAGTPAAAIAGTSAPAELATRLDALESGLDALGKKVDAAPAAAPAGTEAPAGASTESVAALGNRVGALEDKLGALPASAPAAKPEDVAANDARIGVLEQKLANLPAPSPSASPEDLAAANARIANLEQKLVAIASAQQSSGQGAAQLVSLAALRDAVAGSKPFTTELKAARAVLGTEGAPLAALERHAADGFADGPELAAQLRSLLAPPPAATPTSAGIPTDEGVLDRLMRSAQGLVTVRRAEGTPKSSGAAQAEAALTHGDLAGAREALAGLPDAERAKAQPVIDALQARQSALNAIAGLNQHVLASLAGGAQ